MTINKLHQVHLCDNIFKLSLKQQRYVLRLFKLACILVPYQTTRCLTYLTCLKLHLQHLQLYITNDNCICTLFSNRPNNFVYFCVALLILQWYSCIFYLLLLQSFLQHAFLFDYFYFSITNTRNDEIITQDCHSHVW